MADQHRALQMSRGYGCFHVGRERVELHLSDRRPRAVARQVERNRPKASGLERLKLRRPDARGAADAMQE
jgi:hypothetical protein